MLVKYWLIGFVIYLEICNNVDIICLFIYFVFVLIIFWFNFVYIFLLIIWFLKKVDCIVKLGNVFI